MDACDLIFCSSCCLIRTFLCLWVQESLIGERDFNLNFIFLFWLRIVLELSIDVGIEPAARLVLSGPLEECIGPCICLFHAPNRIHATYNISYGSLKIRRRDIASFGHFSGVTSWVREERKKIHENNRLLCAFQHICK